MRKLKHSKVMGFLNVSGEAEIHTIPKTWGKWIPIKQGKHGKAQTFQSYGFLKCFRWKRYTYISQNMRKTIIQGKYGKAQTFRSYGFLKCFRWSRYPYNSQNTGKMNFHNTNIVWESPNIPMLWVSKIFRVKRKSIQFPKYGENESP